MDRNDELLISHDELVIVCKTQMEVILRAGLHLKLDKKLYAAKVEPGFAARAESVQQEFKRERLMLMGDGKIH